MLARRDIEMIKEQMQNLPKPINTIQTEKLYVKFHESGEVYPVVGGEMEGKKDDWWQPVQLG